MRIICKKILISIWGNYVPKVDVKYLYNRIVISYNRKGLTAFAVFLLSFFVELSRKPVCGVGCRSPPINLKFQKFRLIGGTKNE